MRGLGSQVASLFMLMAFACCSWATTYDPLLLRAQSSIFPKIVLLDKDVAIKSPDNEVLITVVSMKQDVSIAQQLQSTIKEKYGDHLGDKKLIINMVAFEDIEKAPLATAYIVLQGSRADYEGVVSIASANNRIVFSYSYTDFEYKPLISLYVKEKTYIYVNKSSLQLYDIKFLPVFYKLTKIVE